jgi:hypothetical protein
VDITFLTVVQANPNGKYLHIAEDHLLYIHFQGVQICLQGTFNDGFPSA